jgi:DNA-binding response OmpR family regulator
VSFVWGNSFFMVEYKELHKLTKNLSILFVEDDSDFQKETCEVLNYFFDKIDLACNGKDGLEKYLSYFSKHSKYYDIVISDINMPKMNGIELSKTIFTYNETQPIIVISAHDESQYLIELLNIGVEHFLMKPIEYDKTLEALSKVSNKIKKTLDTEIKTTTFTLDDMFSWDDSKSLLFNKNENVKLTKKETLLMQLFIKNGTRFSTTQEICNLLWVGEVHMLSEDALLPILSRFRKKLPKNIIENIYGLGYRLNF